MWSEYLKLPEFLRISGNDVEKTLMNMNLKKDAKILDVGCAYGRISLFLKNKDYYVLAVDNDKKMIKFTKDLGIKTSLMDATNLGIKENSFDLVVTDGLLEHFKNPDKIINEQKKVTRKYIINFIPQNTKINKILEVIQRTPRVYWKNKNEWFKKHQMCLKKVIYIKLLRLEVFICEK